MFSTYRLQQLVPALCDVDDLQEHVAWWWLKFRVFGWSELSPYSTVPGWDTGTKHQST